MTLSEEDVAGLAELRGAIRDVLGIFLPIASREGLIALGNLHTIDSRTLLRLGVPLPKEEA